MKKAVQKHKAPTKLSPEEVIQFMDDFSKVVTNQDQPTKLISLRVPENVLKVFKAEAQRKGFKYQSLIVRLMREWIAKE